MKLELDSISYSCQTGLLSLINCRMKVCILDKNREFTSLVYSQVSDVLISIVFIVLQVATQLKIPN